MKPKAWLDRLMDGSRRPDSFLLQVVTLLTGTALAQVVAVLIMPLITRLYAPEDVGIFAVFTSLLSILSVVACWRFEFAIVLPEQEKDADNLLVLSLGASLVSGALLLVGVLLFGGWITTVMGVPRLANWIWLLPLSVVAGGWGQAFNYVATRGKRFKLISASQVGQTGAGALLQAGAGIAHTGALGLLLAQFMSQCAAVAILARTGRLRDVAAAASFPEMRRLAGVYRQFPLVNTWPSLLNILASMLPVMFLSSVYGEETTGQFSLAMRVLTIPLMLIGASMAQVLLPRFARDGCDRAATAALLENVVGKLLLMGGGLLGILMFAPLLFKHVFGAQWLMAGNFARILALSMAAKFVVSPVSIVLLTRNRQDILTCWQIAYMVLTMAMLMASRYAENPEMTVACIAVTDLFSYAVYLYLILRVSGARYQGICSSMANVFRYVIFQKKISDDGTV